MESGVGGSSLKNHKSPINNFLLYWPGKYFSYRFLIHIGPGRTALAFIHKTETLHRFDS